MTRKADFKKIRALVDSAESNLKAGRQARGLKKLREARAALMHLRDTVICVKIREAGDL